jgi:dsDNA-specific endonuclease/ATPase MutS2
LDLHIEKLTEEHGSMASHEKLTFQLNAFEKWLNQVELHYMKHVFVIHGIGKGTLKDEIHNLLKHRTSVKSFVQQYHPWYGHGATEIFLK